MLAYVLNYYIAEDVIKAYGKKVEFWQQRICKGSDEVLHYCGVAKLWGCIDVLLWCSAVLLYCGNAVLLCFCGAVLCCCGGAECCGAVLL